MDIKDSGDRTQFQSGAVRDMHEGKGDMVSIPWEAILRLSKHYEAGAKKYNRFNYRKGINLSSYIDSACRWRLVRAIHCWKHERFRGIKAAAIVASRMAISHSMDYPIRFDGSSLLYRFGNSVHSEAQESRV